MKPTITNQAIFDKVWNHFVVNKGPASYDSSATMCKYRGPNGAKCAVGLFISDKDYSKTIENYTVDTNCVHSLLPFDLERGQICFLLTLQSCHDKAVALEPDSFHVAIERRLRETAEIYNLLIPCPLS